jgi:predicted ATPase
MALGLPKQPPSKSGKPMLERIHIENYKCLRDVTVDLGPFTVLIGPNDSGKSSFLKAIRALGRTTTEELGAVFKEDEALANLVWRKEAGRNIIWDVAGKALDAEFEYRLELPIPGLPSIELLKVRGAEAFRSRENQPRPPTGRTILGAMGQNTNPAQLHTDCWRVKAALDSTIEFHFDPARMTKPSAPQANAALSVSGDNLAGFLDGLLSGPDRSKFHALEEDLHSAIPTISRIALPAKTAVPGAKSIEFVLAGDGAEPVTIPATLASSGAMLLTAFLALAYSKTPDLVLIEEPENGLHPSRLQLVVDVLRKMTTGELGSRPRQVLITTHNPLLLNYIKPEEVRVFVRDQETGTHVTPMKNIPDIDRLMKEFALGELWYLLGEEKLFAGTLA